MNYVKKSFSVGPSSARTYADNWERTFRGPIAATTLEVTVCPKCGVILELAACECEVPCPPKVDPVR